MTIVVQSGVLRPSIWSAPSGTSNTLVFWHDATVTSSMFTDAGITQVSADNDRVYQWNDLSGHGNHQIRRVNHSQPFYRTGSSSEAINGKAVCQFKENDGFAVPANMDNINNGSLSNSLNTITYCVFQTSTGATVRSTAGLWTNFESILMQYHVAEGGKGQLFSNGTFARSTVDPRIGPFACYAKIYSTGHAVKFTGESVEVTANVTNSGQTYFRLGGWDESSSVTWLNANIGEIFQIKNYNQRDIDSASAYFLAKWNVVI